MGAAGCRRSTKAATAVARLEQLFSFTRHGSMELEMRSDRNIRRVRAHEQSPATAVAIRVRRVDEAIVYELVVKDATAVFASS